MKEVSDLKAKVSSLESQLRDSENRVKVNTMERLEREKLTLSAEVRDLKAQLHMKSSNVEKLEKEKADLEKQLSERKHTLDRTPSVEVRSRLVERLQTEKAELQRQLQQMEKERDTLRLATPGRVRDSSSRNSLSVLRESGIKIRAELEDKVRRLERVVSELEKKMDISSATSVDKDTLKREIEQLRIQIKETAEAEAQDVVPQSQYESLRDSHEKVLRTVKDLQVKVEQLQDEKLRLERSSVNKAASESRVRDLEARVKTLEEENSQLKGQLSELKQQHKKLEVELASEKRSAKAEVEKLQTRNSATSNRLVGDLTQEKHALESKVKSLERQLESLQVSRLTSAWFRLCLSPMFFSSLLLCLVVLVKLTN